MNKIYFMKSKNSCYNLVSVLIFVGLLPLTFTFSKNETQLLMETSFKYIVWGGQATILLVLLLTKHTLSKNQLIALAILFVLVPFTFTFNEKGATYLILTKYTSSVLSWAIASILFSKLLFTNKLNQDSAS